MILIEAGAFMCNEKPHILENLKTYMFGQIKDFFISQMLLNKKCCKRFLSINCRPFLYISGIVFCAKIKTILIENNVMRDLCGCINIMYCWWKALAVTI